VNYTSTQKDILKTAILIRCTEKRLLDLFSQGKLYGTVHTCIGQELTGAVLARFLNEDDYKFSNHRCHGHCIAFTDQVEGLIAEVMGKAAGLCGGHGGSQHLCYQRFFSNGIQGGFVPITAGLALGEKLKGTKNIACCFIGEGTLGEGSVYESANLISKWALPALIVLENNRYSQSTPQEMTIAGELLDRFAAFGIECFETSTWDLENLYNTAQKAVEYCRSGKPAVMRIQTDRLMAHSKGDDDRPKEAVAKFWEKDVLSIFKKENPELYQKYETEANKRIDKAVETALKAPYAEEPKQKISTEKILQWHKPDIKTNERLNELIRDCFNKNMKQNDKIVMIGEDIRDPYGGSFKVTKGLSIEFPERVLNTAISEAAIAGIGNGLAINGMLPVCEIMFGDFMTLAFDQIMNHAAKFPYMYNWQINNPLIIRSPMGGGRGYGPTHSQSLEKFFLGIPQTTVLYMNHRYNPADMYDQLFSEIKNPVLFFENKQLYSKRLNGETEKGFVLEYSNEHWPVIRIRPEAKPDVTIVCYGGILPVAEKVQIEAFDNYEIVSEIICPLCLYPMNIQAVYESLEQSGKMLIVEEGYSFAAWGSEIVTRILERSTSVLHDVKRVSMSEYPIPCSGPLELQMLPNEKSVLAALKELVAPVGTIDAK
jgi:2-oxoisovalerate dehydrogenase E1 component